MMSRARTPPPDADPTQYQLMFLSALCVCCVCARVLRSAVPCCVLDLDGDADSDQHSDSDDFQAECCPVSDEPYTETGPHQPVFLPECGHTFARATVEQLVSNLRTIRPLRRYVLCPLCNTQQQSLERPDDCRPNWDTIYRLQRPASRGKSNGQQRARVAARVHRRVEIVARGTSEQACSPLVADVEHWRRGNVRNGF
jgi:hypothetical protein